MDIRGFNTFYGPVQHQFGKILDSLEHYLMWRSEIGDRREFFNNYGEFNQYFAELMLNGTIECIEASDIHMGIEDCICTLDPACDESNPGDIAVVQNSFFDRLVSVEI